MATATEAQRVVVIQDASKDVSWKAIKWVLQGLSFRPGDELTLVGILHQVNNPSTLSFTELLGYKTKVESTNPKLVEEDVARKKEEYSKNPNAQELLNQCELEKVKFRIEVQAGPNPKMVALNAAKKLMATWVILDRQMKKDKKYFLDQLVCGISRMKHNNSVEKLREPKAIGDTKPPAEKSTASYVTYGEMIPGSIELGETAQKSPISQKTNNSDKGHGGTGSRMPTCENHQKSPVSKSSANNHPLTTSVSSSSKGNTEVPSASYNRTKSSSSNFQEEENNMNPEKETVGNHSLFSILDAQEKGQTETYNIESPAELQQHSRDGDWVEECNSDEVFENSICSGCKNRRPRVGWMKEFKYKELLAATNGFSRKNFLSEGGFGFVYRGRIKNGLDIAVKQHKDFSFQGEKEFKSEVEVLSRTRHKNLVMLLGSCSEGSNRLLVYEYVCNGSLDKLLPTQKGKSLNWDKRVKIAIGAAKGLEYLHRNNIIHRDVRPSNILITHDYEPLLGDFGLARAQHEDSDNSETTVVGTCGYLAPEYVDSRRASTKSDVYSFGMVLLQLITGLRPTDKIEIGKSLIEWARPLLEEKNYPALIGKRISEFHDMHQLFWMVQVAEKCLRIEPRKRWTMERVVDALNYMIEGDTTCSIQDFSPAQKDEGCSKANSPESNENAVAINEDESPNTNTEEVSTIDAKNGTGSWQSTWVGGITNSEEKGKTTSSSQNKRELILYDEMIV